MADLSSHLYPAGTVLLITPHKQATPAEARRYVPSKAESDLVLSGEWPDRVKSVFRFPIPHPPQSSAGQPRELRLGQALASGWFNGAQLVLCNWVDAPSTTYVAKIYDPLYYEHPEEEFDFDDIRITLNRQAHLEYVCESAAYQWIEANKETRPGRSTPDYFGSWMFSAPRLLTPEGCEVTMESSSRPQDRTVHLVLMEYIRGCTLSKIGRGDDGILRLENFQRVSIDCRLFVLGELLKVESWLRHIGIHHGDMFGRNIMLAPCPVLDDHSAAASRQKPRVVVIDFGIAMLEDAVSRAGLPPNPMSRYWHDLPTGMETGYVPEWWVSELPQRRRWLLKEFGGRKAASYAKCPALCGVDELTRDDRRFQKQIALGYIRD